MTDIKIFRISRAAPASTRQEAQQAPLSRSAAGCVRVGGGYEAAEHLLARKPSGPLRASQRVCVCVCVGE